MIWPTILVLSHNRPQNSQCSTNLWNWRMNWIINLNHPIHQFAYTLKKFQHFVFWVGILRKQPFPVTVPFLMQRLATSRSTLALGWGQGGSRSELTYVFLIKVHSFSRTPFREKEKGEASSPQASFYSTLQHPQFPPLLQSNNQSYQGHEISANQKIKVFEKSSGMYFLNSIFHEHRHQHFFPMF